MGYDFTTGAPQLTVNPDGSILKDGKMLGVANNPGYIIDSTELKGPDAYSIADEGTAMDYYGGTAVRADGPNKKIVETGWMPAGTLRDNMMVSMVIKPGALPGGTEPSGLDAMLRGYIIRRNPKTKAETMRNPIAFPYIGMAADVGVVARAGWGNSHSIDFFNFSDKYEYKIELYTGDQLEDKQSMIADYMYFTYIPRVSWSGTSQWAFGADPITEPIYIIEVVNCSCSTDASGNGSIYINQRHLNQASTTYNTMTAIFNNIDFMDFSFWDGCGDGTSGYEMYWGAGYYHSGPGYGCRIDIFSSAVGSGTIYGQAVIIGGVNPTVV